VRSKKYEVRRTESLKFEVRSPSSKFEVARAETMAMTINWQARVMRIAVLAVAVAAASGCSYNRFTAAEEAIKAQWGQVENQLQRRNDLIPNLVATVQGFAAQEKAVIQSVADARAKRAGATTPADQIAAANEQS